MYSDSKAMTWGKTTRAIGFGQTYLLELSDFDRVKCVYKVNTRIAKKLHAPRKASNFKLRFGKLQNSASIFNVFLYLLKNLEN